MTIHHIQYVVSGIINIIGNNKDEEPWVRCADFDQCWAEVATEIRAWKQGQRLELNRVSWQGLAKRLGRMNRLRVFDTAGESLNYATMLQPGRVNIIDLSDLDNIDVRNLAIAEILRGVQIAQAESYESRKANGKAPIPANVIIEEAHEFLSAHRIRKMPTMREQVETIAKRGRKRFLGLTFVSQMPEHLPDELLGLINNWILHKLPERDDSRRLRKQAGGIDDSLWNLLTKQMAPGQAVVYFTHLRRALVVWIDPARCELRMVD